MSMPRFSRAWFYRILWLLGLVASVEFATPHRSRLGDGSVLVWTVGLSRPWWTDIRASHALGPAPGEPVRWLGVDRRWVDSPAEGGVQGTREQRLRFGGMSFVAGWLALSSWGAWLWLTWAGAGSDPGVRGVPRGWRRGAVWVAAAGTGAVGGVLGMAMVAGMGIGWVTPWVGPLGAVGLGCLLGGALSLALRRAWMVDLG